MRYISYPIFLSCRNYTDDLFWKRIFENLAYGETPRGIHFKENILYSNIKKKEFNYNFENKDANVIFEDLYNIFRKISGLKSKEDLMKKIKEFDEFKKTNSLRKNETDWGKIKKKTLKENLIQDYVLQIKSKYNYSMKKIRHLYFYIMTGCVFKIINNNDIHLKNGYIERIDGITFEENNIIYHRKITDPPILKKENEKNSYLYLMWENYLKNLN